MNNRLGWRWTAVLVLGLIGSCRQSRDDGGSREINGTFSSPSSVPSPLGTPIYSISKQVFVPTNLTVSPDGRWLACRQSRGELQAMLLLFDAATGQKIDQKPLPRGGVGELVWSGSDRLVSSNSATQVWKVSRAGRLAPVALFRDAASAPASPPVPLPVSPPISSPVPLPFSPPVSSFESNSRGRGARLVQISTVSAVHQLGARLVSGARQKGQASSQWIEIFAPRNEKTVGQFVPSKLSPANREPLEFSPTGPPRLLVEEVPDQFSLRFSVWEPRSKRRLWEQSVPGLNPMLDWTPDARFIIATQVTGSRGRDLFPLHETLIFEARTGKKVRALPTQSTVYAVTVSGDTLFTYGTQNRPDKRQNWTSLQGTNWRTGQKLFHCWMPAGVGRIESIAASARSGTIFGNEEGLVLWRTADLKRGNGAFKTVASPFERPSGPDEE